MWNGANDPQEYPDGEDDPDARSILVEALEDGHHAWNCPVGDDASCFPDESKCTCWVSRARALFKAPEVPIYEP